MIWYRIFSAWREANASNDGNASGIAWVQNNPGSYGLYTEAEKNASDALNYATGLSDGNTSGIAWVQNNPGSYGLYTGAEKNASDADQYANGVAESQAKLAEVGLASLHYLEQIDTGDPYTSKWYYQPGVGWLWTNKQTFPFIYRAEDIESGISASWLYLNQVKRKEYDFPL